MELKENYCLLVPQVHSKSGWESQLCSHLILNTLWAAVTGMRLHLLPHPTKPQCCALWSDSGQGYNCWLESISELRLPVLLISFHPTDGWMDRWLLGEGSIIRQLL